MIDFLKNIPLTSIAVFDIETAPQHIHPTELPPALQGEFFRRFKTAKEEDMWEDDKFKQKYFGKAGLFSEWGKVVCVSISAFNKVGDIFTKSYYSQYEEELLEAVNKVLEKKEYICGHNVLNFDIPFLARRMVLNKIKPTKKLNVFGLKPWACKNVIDTMTLWAGTSQSYRVSLNLLSQLLNLPSPKEDINGSDVGRVYWEEPGGLSRIVEYCERDTETTAKILKILKG